MIIGVPKETKTQEYRVALTPAGADALVRAGHRVMVENGAGEESGFREFGLPGRRASIARLAPEVWEDSEMIVKVKEPLPSEYKYFPAGADHFYLFTSGRR